MTSLAGSSCTESIVASVADLEWLEQFSGHGLDICGSGRLVRVEAAEGVGVTSTEDSPAGVAGSGACGGEPLKTRTCGLCCVFLSPRLKILVRWIVLGSSGWLTEAHLVATPDLVALGPDAGAVGIAVQEHFGSPCARRHLEKGAEYQKGFLCFAVPRQYALSGQHVRRSLGD